MITKIRLEEYGPFREAEFSLAPLTVLVGPNASGKTMAMESVFRIEHSYREVVAERDLELTTAFGKNDSTRVSEVLDEVRERVFRHRRRTPSLQKSRVLVETSKGSTVFSDRSAVSAKEMSATDAWGWLPWSVLLKLEPADLRRPSYLDASVQSISATGYGLATVLADMKLQDEARLKWIAEHVRKVIPSFKGVRFRRADVPRSGDDTIAGQELIFDMEDVSGLHPKVVSDGTLLVLGIVTKVAVETMIRGDIQESWQETDLLVLVDELERALHPRALGELVKFLRAMTEEMNIQIIATSHSPYLLDYLKPEEVRLTGFRDDGSATICELSDHPEFERWKDVMTPGEFWATAGEDWIREVRK